MNLNLIIKEFKKTIILGISFVTFMMIFFTIVFPFLIQSGVDFISKDMEKNIGQMVFDNYLEEKDVNYEGETNFLLDHYAKIIASFDSLEQDEINIVIVEDDSVQNAFALPGGYIVLYRGILDLMQDQNELIGLLAHEYGHVHHRHGIRRMVRESFIGFIFMFLIGSDQQTETFFASQSQYLINRAYDRSEEEEADQYAIEMLTNLGYDPKGFLKLLEHLKTIEEKQITIPAFLSTHPDIDDRINWVKNQIGNTEATNSVLSEDQWNYLVLKDSSKMVGIGEIRLSMILVRTKYLADGILGKLSEGESFEKMAKLHSIDASGYLKDGDLGYFKRGEIEFDFYNAIKDLSVGEFSKIIETKNGFAILKKTDEKIPKFQRDENILKGNYKAIDTDLN